MLGGARMWWMLEISCGLPVREFVSLVSGRSGSNNLEAGEGSEFLAQEEDSVEELPVVAVVILVIYSADFVYLQNPDSLKPRHLFC